MLHAVAPPRIARVGPEDHEKRQREGCDCEWLVEHRHNIFWRPVRRPPRLQTTQQLRSFPFSTSSVMTYEHDPTGNGSVSQKGPGKYKTTPGSQETHHQNCVVESNEHGDQSEVHHP